MKKLFFLFAMFVNVAASATVTVTPLSTDYANNEVTFKVAWTNSPTAPYNNRVWIWIDFCPVAGTIPAASFSTATISNPTKTGGNGTITNATARGFFIEYAAANAGTTVTAVLSTASGKFNWCAYGSDYPPNATITSTGYQLKGTPPFSITYNNGSSTVTDNNTFNSGCINTLTDATGCPGLVDALSAPTNSTNASRCNAGTVVISATPPPGSTIDWYTTASGTTTVTNGTGVATLTTPSISNTTNYYAASRHLVTGCVSSSRRTVTATVTNGSGRDVAPNSCGCASGLTSVGGYCRDLAADGASTNTSCGFEVKLSNPTVATGCPSGWSIANKDQLECMRSNLSDFGVTNLVYRSGDVLTRGHYENVSYCTSCTAAYTWYPTPSLNPNRCTYGCDLKCVNNRVHWQARCNQTAESTVVKCIR